MRYVILHNCKVGSGHYAQAGDEVELDKERADALLDAGLIEPPKAKTAKKPAKPDGKQEP